VQFMTVQPASSYTKDVWVLGKGHELSFPLEKAQGVLGKSVEVENLEGTWDGRVSGRLWTIGGIVNDRGRAETDGWTSRVIFGAVAVFGFERDSEKRGRNKDLKSWYSSLTAPMKEMGRSVAAIGSESSRAIGVALTGGALSRPRLAQSTPTPPSL
jgi:hypothetical protein